MLHNLFLAALAFFAFQTSLSVGTECLNQWNRIVELVSHAKSEFNDDGIRTHTLIYDAPIDFELRHLFEILIQFNATDWAGVAPGHALVTEIVGDRNADRFMVLVTVQESKDKAYSDPLILNGINTQTPLYGSGDFSVLAA